MGYLFEMAAGDSAEIRTEQANIETVESRLSSPLSKTLGKTGLGVLRYIGTATDDYKVYEDGSIRRKFFTDMKSMPEIWLTDSEDIEKGSSNESTAFSQDTCWKSLSAILLATCVPIAIACDRAYFLF